ncbi:N-acetylglucosamine/diacetylchitobiose ABC transporter substrate-binding protein [Streptomyces zingiberis]|uniref:Carbohydrate ABC transporter, N-acetylglucosamine/diacetylchitobiose-binding protein n=1 Tax=Streptomyces zingiberis TaxID=2053010 RepID=A0ABX1BXC6_9ACTN|nr:N-acetylglucosamine/diacetylchitobiose ABC transporter substrate-binding protein [Streptomyces zingiberis]NJQ01078.1 carbohydrate ABC transporter, N-acetylglucosamine/diacetylchitobiose-binding protein [Streptomyces zingiberis]
MGSPSDHTRRDLIRRAAALGLAAVPASGLLTACASSGGSTSDKAAKGEKSAGNPLGVNAGAPLDVVIFDGGFGDAYAKDAQKIYREKFPKADVKHMATQKIQSVLQPRFNGGTPPDLIDNSGAEQMDLGVLVGQKQLTDLTPLLDAPSYDDPEKKVRDTLRPGVAEMGRFQGDAVHVLYYAYSVFGVWYSQKNLDRFDAEYPKTWDDMLALCARAKKKGVAGWTYAGKNPYYLTFALYPFIAKIGGAEVLRAIDDLEPDAWRHPAVRDALEAYHELQRKGYVLRGTPGLTHTESQTAWTEGDALFIPNGSWVENEAKATMPKDFELRVAGPSALNGSDELPAALWAAGGEPFIVPAKAKNPEGGMEQLRIMLSEKSSRNFTGQVSSLTSFDGGTDGLTLPPGLGSAVEALEQTGENTVNPLHTGWYGALWKERIGAALGEMMAGRLTPGEAVRKIQADADATAEDDSITHYRHR